jgi:hypothetical protein
MCKKIGVKLEKKHWYKHVSKSAETRHEVKVTTLWIQQAKTDRTIPNNKPNIIIRDNEKRTYLLRDTAISGNGNVIKKEAENISQYTDLTIKIQGM